jgi:AraC family transcriptional regulator
VEPKIVAKEAFTVAGLVYRGTVDGEKLAALWRQFGERMHELQNVIRPNVCYGVMANYDESTGEFDYIAASQVAGVDGQPPGFTWLTLPAADWAVFTTTMAGMPQTYPYIYGTWLPASGYQHGPAPEFELYDGEHFDPENPSSALEIYIPVVRA